MLKSQYPQRTVQNGTCTYTPNGSAVATRPDGRAQVGSPPSSGTGMPEGSAGTYFFFSLGAAASEESAAMNASFGTSTEPMFFMRFLPSFCFSSSLRLRLMSPP